MFCRWSPIFLIFCWLVIMMVMVMDDGDDYDDHDDNDDYDGGEDWHDGVGHGQCHDHNSNSGAFSLVLVEKSFLAIFSANQKVRLLIFLGLCSVRVTISS